MDDFLDNRAAKIFANATPDWVSWRVRFYAMERVYEMRASDDGGRMYALSYGMVNDEERERILSGVNPEKHFAAINLLAAATGRNRVVSDEEPK